MRWRRGDEDGAVTAEIALCLPAVVLLLAGLLCVWSALGTQQRCAEAARAGARAAARGEPDGAVASTARAVAGRPVQVSLVRQAGLVRVTVTAGAPTLPAVGLPPIVVRATATGADERVLSTG